MPIKNEKGEVVLFLLSFKDLTESYGKSSRRYSRADGEAWPRALPKFPVAVSMNAIISISISLWACGCCDFARRHGRGRSPAQQKQPVPLCQIAAEGQDDPAARDQPVQQEGQEDADRRERKHLTRNPRNTHDKLEAALLSLFNHSWLLRDVRLLCFD